MNAVLRLNLLVTLMFVLALTVTLSQMLVQAGRDIEREVTAGVSFTHQLLSAAETDQQLLDSLLTGESRHVRISLLNSDQVPRLLENQPVAETADHGDLPEWLFDLIPAIDALEEKHYYRYLPDGQVLQLQADTSDEVAEVWESVQQVLLLFGLSALLSNLAIYLGVRQGLRPVADFLAALKAIEKGRLNARLETYSIKEINELSSHFNAMAEAIQQAEQDNSRLTQALINLQEKERAYLARELHDDLGQYLTGIRAQAYMIKQVAAQPELAGSVSNMGEQISNNCDAMQTSFRQLIRDLHPVILEQLGLLEAIRALVQGWERVQGIRVELQLPEQLPVLTDESHTHIYRIIQEALNNVARHADASRVRIQMLHSDKQLILTIEDNGLGVPDHSRGGLGLRSMQERARCLQGHLSLNQGDNGGCQLLLTMQLQPELQQALLSNAEECV